MIDGPEFFEKEREPLDMEIKKIARDNEDVRPLMTITGIDHYLTSLLSSYIGDVYRFPSADKLAPFFGDIPETRDSSTKNKRGHMSKKGAATARLALSIVVDTVTLRNKPLKEYYNSVKNRKGSGKYAHASTMRKLVRMINTVLKKRKEWKCLDTALTESKLQDLIMTESRHSGKWELLHDFVGHESRILPFESSLPVSALWSDCMKMFMRVCGKDSEGSLHPGPMDTFINEVFIM